MRRGLLIGIVAGVIVVAAVGAVLIYLLTVPGRLAGDYEADAKPEHEKAERALDPVYDSFSSRTFGSDYREVARADDPGEYVRAVKRVTGRDLREMAPARREIQRAQAKLDRIDEEALTEPPDWPLLGGRGDLREAEEIADREADYLGKAKRFLREYRRLIEYEIDSVRVFRRIAITIGRGADAIPENADSPDDVARPVERSVRQVESQLRAFKRVKAPPERKAEQRNVAASIGVVVRELKRFASAIRRLDLATARQVDRRLARGTKPYDRRTRKLFRRLLTRSIYVRQIKDLKRRERQIAVAWKKL